MLNYPIKLVAESDFTESNEWCEHPERWHSTDIQSTEVEVTEFIGAFVRAMQPDLVVETGSAYGQTAEAIGVSLLLNGQGTLNSYETELERVEVARDRTANLPVQIHHQSSLDGLEFLKVMNKKVDLAFLDSLFELRPQELARLVDLLSPGGVVIIHDTAPHHKMWEQMNLRGWHWINLHTPRGVAMLQRNWA